MSNVTEKLCDEKHNAIEYKLNSLSSDINTNNARLRKVEDAVIILTNMAKVAEKRDVFDKFLIIIAFLISIVLCAVVIGPELTGQIIGGISR